MREFESLFIERANEVRLHLSAVDKLDGQIARAMVPIPLLQAVSIDQLNIIKSGFLIQLYSLVEAVMTKVLEEVSNEVLQHAPANWGDHVMREWVRVRGGLGRDLRIDERLDRVFSLLGEFSGVQSLKPWRFRPVEQLTTWSNDEMVSAAAKLGCTLNISAQIVSDACTVHFSNEMAPMKFVRHKRNNLAHGNETFLDGAKDLTPAQLAALMEPVVGYLEEVCRSFSTYLDAKAFLRQKAG